MISHAGSRLTSVSQATASLHSVQLSALLQGTSAVDVEHVLRTEKFWLSLDSSFPWRATRVVTSSPSGKVVQDGCWSFEWQRWSGRISTGLLSMFPSWITYKTKRLLSRCVKKQKVLICVYNYWGLQKCISADVCLWKRKKATWRII